MKSGLDACKAKLADGSRERAGRGRLVFWLSLSLLLASLAQAALAVFDVDERGLDRLDRAVLDSLIRGHGGGPDPVP